MAKSTLRYTVNVDGTPKKVLSVALLKSSGDIVFDIKPSPFNREGPNSVNLRDKILSHKLSLHRSQKSSTGNTITSTLLLASGEKSRTQQFTKALKTFDRFAPVYFRLIPDVSDVDRQDHDSTVASISVGNIDVRRFSLILGLFVSRAERKFTIEGDLSGCMLIQQQLGDFNIVVTATYLSLPSIQHGDTHIVLSSMYEQHNGYTGLDELGSLMLLDETISTFRESYITKVVQYIYQNMDKTMLRDIARVFSRGTVDGSEESKKHFKYVESKYDLNFGKKQE